MKPTIIKQLLSLSLVCMLVASVYSSLAQAQDDFSPEALLQYPTTSWPTNGGDSYNRRFSPLTQINHDNVANLKGVWRTHLNGSGTGPRNSGEAAPIVYNGVAYIITGDDDVFALSIATGEILWNYQANLNFLIDTVCCGWTSRGVGIGDGRIYVGQLDGKLLALDMNNGTVLWETQAERWEEGYTITAAPLYYDGMVFTGFSGGERGIRGKLSAFDASTGEPLWSFNNIPGPGEFGHDTWPQDNTVWMDGGASVWQTPAVDPELGLLYYSTGNAGPDFNGRVRAGDNLFASSILALDLHTGAYRWHFQEVHHDIWDYDAPNPVILFDIEIDGVERKALSQAGKTGWLYILDRITGAPLIGIEEKPVPQEAMMYTSPTQPYPVGDAFVPQSIRITPEGYKAKNNGQIFTPFWTESVVIAPGVAGGANWPPSAHDPRTGFTYVCAADKPFVFEASDISTERPAPGAGYNGGPFRGEPDLDAGQLVYQTACTACHGNDGRGGHGGGIDLVNASSFELVAATVSRGRNNMPAMGAVFTPEQLRDVAAYVAQRIAR